MKPELQPDKRSKYTELLIGLMEQIREGFIAELKMNPDDAKKAAEIAIEMIREHAGGGLLYIGKGHLFAVTEKHWRIYNKFSGANHTQLAREFGVTERHIYSIIERCQGEVFEKSQLKLFAVNE